MKVLGVVHAYNEEDCVDNAVRCLTQAGIDTVLFDHGSTDATRERAKEAGARIYPVDRDTVPMTDADGKQTARLWNHIAGYLRYFRAAGIYDWTVWLDADEILRQPDGKLVTVRALEQAAERFDVIRPLIRAFSPTKGDGREGNYLRRIRNYREGRPGHAPRAWKIEVMPEDLPIARHLQDPATGDKLHWWYGYWPEGTRVSNNVWLLDHYPIRTTEQMRKKVRDRDWISPPGTRPYERIRRAFKRKMTPPIFRSVPMHEARELPMP
jgi:glycosyltransferase involved in cell wall biosynthesis